MSIPLDWLVFFFFIILASTFFIVYEINSKFKWRARSSDLEEEIQKLKIKLSSSPDIKIEYNEIMSEIKKDLTSRQFQIFIQILEGLSSKEIAETLNLSSNTIDSHIKEMMKSLNVNRRSQLASVFFSQLKKKLNMNSLLDN